MLTHDEILDWLRTDDERTLAELWSLADSIRHYCVGNEVHLRGLIEISNWCVRQCGYCGLRSANLGITRYRMERDEILECAHEAVRLGYGTVVMQAGEDPGLEAHWVADLIETIKRTTPLAVTLSLGERAEEELRLWKDTGANRYLLRFETSDRGLYDMIHPSRNGIVSDRIAILKQLREIGYEVGSGVMVGIPGQTYHSLSDDLQLFRDLDLDMIGIGPFIPHPQTPLGQRSWAHQMAAGEQVPASEQMVYKMVALARVMCPEANIPATTALATINKTTGRENGLQRGANVIMPNLTPTKYRVLYEIYPDKACVNETAQQCNGCLRGRIHSIGRSIGTGQGGRKKQQ